MKVPYKFFALFIHCLLTSAQICADKPQLNFQYPINLQENVSESLEFQGDEKYGHGFAGTTLIKTMMGFTSIAQLCEHHADDEQYVVSINPADARPDYSSCIITNARKLGTTNCYYNLYIDGYSYSMITTTPLQEFYLPLQKKWVPAYALKKGDVLLGAYLTGLPIARIEFIKQTLTFYSLEVEGTYNFFVGNPGVLTHNVALSELRIGLGIPCGAGALAGGRTGIVLGAPGMFLGATIGGIIGYTIAARRNNRQLAIQYETANLERLYFEKEKQSEPNKVSKKLPSQDSQAPMTDQEKVSTDLHIRDLRKNIWKK